MKECDVPHPESVKVCKLFRDFSLGNREAVFNAQRFSLLQCNYVIPKGGKWKPRENKKVYGRDISNIR